MTLNFTQQLNDYLSQHDAYRLKEHIRELNEAASPLIQLHLATVTKTYHDDQLLTIEQFADYVGIQPNTIRKMRSCGVDLPTQLGSGKMIRYRKSDIDAWLERNARIALGGQS